jgi:hypothetical protein
MSQDLRASWFILTSISAWALTRSLVDVKWRKVRLTRNALFCVAAYEASRNLYYMGKSAWRYWVMHPPAR